MGCALYSLGIRSPPTWRKHTRRKIRLPLEMQSYGYPLQLCTFLKKNCAVKKFLLAWNFEAGTTPLPTKFARKLVGCRCLSNFFMLKLSALLSPFNFSM